MRPQESYAYVGPDDLKSLASPDSQGRAITSLAEFTAWADGRTSAELPAVL